jgi:hypothetical protein
MTSLYALPGRDYVQLRMGLRKGGVDLSLFVDNLTNSRDLLARARQFHWHAVL